MKNGLSLCLCVSVVIALAGLAAAQQEHTVRFNNIVSEAKIAFKHDNGASPQKFMPETMAGGSILLDYNNDGWPDVFLVNGGSFSDKQRAANARHRRYPDTWPGRSPAS